jgi:4-oxalocrotonate tautomerase
MPLVRIDMPEATTAAQQQALSQAVHTALVTHFNVPLADKFHTLSPRRAGELVCTPAFLGVTHSDRVVFIQITCSPGRSVEQKRALYAEIASRIATTGTGISAADVIINLVESARENWSFGEGLAHYALPESTD